MTADPNRVPVVPCPDGCGTMKSDSVPAGQHAPHYNTAGVLVNCVGQPL